jgi:ankyrin repeat protein
LIVSIYRSPGPEQLQHYNPAEPPWEGQYHPQRVHDLQAVTRPAGNLAGIVFTIDQNAGLAGVGATFTETDSDLAGSSVLHVAAYCGHVNAVRWLIGWSGGRFRTYAKNDRGSTPLLLAAEQGKLPVVQFLLVNGHSDPEESDDTGSTALLCAASGGHLDTVRWLLESRRACSDEGMEGGLTALLVAAGRGHLATVQWLITSGQSFPDECCILWNTALSYAVANGKLLVAQWLIRHAGSSASERNDMGDTPLLTAASHGQLAIVQWLLSVDPDRIEETNKLGLTALLLAAHNHHTSTVQWLLQFGGSYITEVSHFNHTALHLASEAAGGQLAMWLLNTAHADPTVETITGDRALCWAARADNHELVAMLLNDGRSDVHHSNCFGTTALTAACLAGCVMSMALLVRQGKADVLATDAEGDNALGAALQGRQSRATEWILKNFPQTIQGIHRRLQDNLETYDRTASILLIAYGATLEPCPPHPYHVTWSEYQLAVSHVVPWLSTQQVIAYRALTRNLTHCLIELVCGYVCSVIDAVELTSLPRSIADGGGPAGRPYINRTPEQQEQHLVDLFSNM